MTANRICDYTDEHGYDLILVICHNGMDLCVDAVDPWDERRLEDIARNISKQLSDTVTVKLLAGETIVRQATA